MPYFDRSSIPPRTTLPADSDVVKPSQARPLFDNEEALNRFMADFSGPNLKYFAPVQSDATGWQDYLSRRELQDYDRARKNIGRGGAAAIGLTIFKIGGTFLLTATVAPAFSLAMGAAAAVAGTIAVASWARAVQIEARAKKREDDAEVTARHVAKPAGPRQ